VATEQESNQSFRTGEAEPCAWTILKSIEESSNEGGLANILIACKRYHSSSLGSQ
jgi:hypothetical protein